MARKPVSIHIDVKRIRDWFPEDRRRMDVVTAYGIVIHFYCNKLVEVGVCPKAAGQECGVCRPYLEAIFNLAEARKPEALATWNAKSQSAQAIEAFRAKPIPAPEDSPAPAAGNFFLDYLKTLEDV